MPITSKSSTSIDVNLSVNSATRSFVITPHDVNYLEQGSPPRKLVTRGIVVTQDGNITVQLVDNPHGTYMTIPLTAGVIYPLQVERVRDTGTDDLGTIYGLL